MIIFGGVCLNKINYRTLTDSEIVKLQDIYDIIYFINPNGIRTLLNTPDTHAIINYVYQRYIKLKIGFLLDIIHIMFGYFMDGENFHIIFHATILVIITIK